MSGRTRKSNEQILDQVYVSIEDIRKLFRIGYSKAKELYGMCDELEDLELGAWRYERRKVRMATLLKVSQVDLSQLRRQIKNAE